jgi:PAS domain S-box-containing protein
MELMATLLHKKVEGYLSAVLGVALVTTAFAPFQDRINSTTVALAYLLLVLFVAMLWGVWPGRITAVLAMLCFDYFFLPPLHTFYIADTQDWIALLAFLVAASMVGHLSTRAKRRAEQVLDLYNRAPCGYHSLDKDGLLVRINDTELEWLGFTRAEIVGKMKFTDVLTPAALKTFEESFPRLKEGEPIQDLELDLVRRNGATIPVLLSATAITDSDGNFQMSRSTVFDITMRKREEAARSQMAAIVESSDDAIISKDLNERVLTWNKAAERIYGYTAAEIVGKPVTILVAPGRPNEVPEILARLKRGESVEHLETVRVRKDGSLIDVSLTISPIKDADGEVLAAATVSRDITERKRTEREILRINRAHRALSACNQALVRATDEAELPHQICRVIVESAGYRFCWVGRPDHDEAKTVRPTARAGYDDGYLETTHITWADTERGHGPTGSCIRTGTTQVAKHIATDPALAPWRTEALKRGFASSIAIPLWVDAKLYGALTIYSAEAEAFGQEEVDLLTELAGDLGYGITSLHTQAERTRAEEEVRRLNADLEDRVLHRTAQLRAANLQLEQSREREISTGFRIQQTLLLDRPPADMPGLRVAALTVPSQRIDGDFYIFVRNSEQCLDAIVGDVMGKGIPAALLGAATKSHLLKALCDLTVLSKGATMPEPREIVSRAHAELVQHLIALDSFVTLCYTRVDMKKSCLDLVDCGHTGIVHLHSRTGTHEILHGDNLPLGVCAREVYRQTAIPFEPGDLFFFFSDGITEARNAAGEFFGVERLEDFLSRHAELEPAVLVEGIRQAVRDFSGSDRLSDDLTSVALRVDASPMLRTEIEISSDLTQLGRVREFVRAVRGSLDDEGEVALELAVNEAASNIIKHAYHGHGGQCIHLRGEVFPGRVSVRLAHLGEPFDAASVPPPALDGSRDSGFGAFIIDQTMDEVRYYRDETGRNCVALTKFRR